MTTVTIPYLATIWATGAFDYNQHTRHSKIDIRTLIGVNLDMTRKRCSVSSPFYIEKTVELVVDSMEGVDKVVFTIDNRNDLYGEFILSETGDFYKPVCAVGEEIARMQQNPVFGSLQRIVDAGDNRKNMRDNHPAEHTVSRGRTRRFVSTIDHIAGFNDLDAGCFIIDDEDGKPAELQKCLKNFTLYDDAFWIKTEEPLILKLTEPDEIATLFGDETRSIYRILECNSYLLDVMDHKTKTRNFLDIEGIPSVFSAWNAKQSGVNLTVTDGNSDLLIMAEHRNLLDMYLQMKQGGYSEPNPLQENITPAYRR